MSDELIDAFVEKYASLSGVAHVAESADAVAPIVVNVLREVGCKRAVFAELPDGLDDAIERACVDAGIDVHRAAF